MKPTILLIDHPVSQRDDRASVRLEAMGYAVEWCCPGKGEPLPAPTGAHIAVVVYGGAESANDDATHAYLAAEMKWIEGWLETGKPYLGICLGAQLLARTLESGWDQVFGKFDPIPNGKTDTNNHGPFSTDNIGMNYDYPEAASERRAEILEEHVQYQKGLMYFLANDPRVPPRLREEMS